MSSKFKDFLPADLFLLKKSKIRKTSSQDQLIFQKSHQTQPIAIVNLKNVFPRTTNTSTWPSRCAAGNKNTLWGSGSRRSLCENFFTLVHFGSPFWLMRFWAASMACFLSSLVAPLPIQANTPFCPPDQSTKQSWKDVFFKKFTTRLWLQQRLWPINIFT